MVKVVARGREKSDRQNLLAAQFGWPLGLPLVDHIDGDIWEVRSKLENRIARVLFVVDGAVMVLLHGFIKKEYGSTDEQGVLDLSETCALIHKAEALLDSFAPSA